MSKERLEKAQDTIAEVSTEYGLHVQVNWFKMEWVKMHQAEEGENWEGGWKMHEALAVKILTGGSNCLKSPSL